MDNKPLLVFVCAVILILAGLIGYLRGHTIRNNHCCECTSSDVTMGEYKNLESISVFGYPRHKGMH